MNKVFLDIFGIINTVCTIGITLVAFYSIYKTNKNFKTSLKNEKVVEIFMILEEFARIYVNLISIYNDLKNYHEAKDNQARSNWFKEYEKNKDNLVHNIQIKSYFDKVTHLEILARSYLTKIAQKKVTAFCRMFRQLLDITINENWMIKDMFWKDGFPAINNLNLYLDDLGQLLINKIGITRGKKKYREELRKYTEQNFKKELNI